MIKIKGEGDRRNTRVLWQCEDGSEIDLSRGVTDLQVFGCSRTHDSRVMANITFTNVHLDLENLPLLGLEDIVLCADKLGDLVAEFGDDLGAYTEQINELGGLLNKHQDVIDTLKQRRQQDEVVFVRRKDRSK